MHLGILGNWRESPIYYQFLIVSSNNYKIHKFHTSGKIYLDKYHTFIAKLQNYDRYIKSRVERESSKHQIMADQVNIGDGPQTDFRADYNDIFDRLKNTKATSCADRLKECFDHFDRDR